MVESPFLSIWSVFDDDSKKDHIKMYTKNAFPLKKKEIFDFKKESLTKNIKVLNKEFTFPLEKSKLHLKE